MSGYFDFKKKRGMVACALNPSMWGTEAEAGVSL